MSNEELHQRREHLRRAIAAAQKRQNEYTGDHAGRMDISKQIGVLHVALLSAGGSMHDKEAIAAGIAQPGRPLRRYIPRRVQ
jgi:hypothetical protein